MSERRRKGDGAALPIAKTGDGPLVFIQIAIAIGIGIDSIHLHGAGCLPFQYNTCALLLTARARARFPPRRPRRGALSGVPPRRRGGEKRARARSRIVCLPASFRTCTAAPLSLTECPAR